jgi:hypothetical protein
VRPLGQAGSPLEWFACPTCHYVWTASASITALAAAPTPPQLPAGHRKHIVVVDDDTLLLQVVERALWDYRVSTARDGSEAITILSGIDPVHLLVTDYLMPVMTGQELVQHARLRRPGLAVLIMTGLAGAAAAADPEWWASERHLAKPFRLEALREAVEALIG